MKGGDRLIMKKNFKSEMAHLKRGGANACEEIQLSTGNIAIISEWLRARQICPHRGGSAA